MADTPLTIPTLIERGKWNDYRDEIWGDSYNWSWNRTPQEVKYVVIHHSVTEHEATPDYIASLHKARGWLGVGYHFIITKDGMVWYVGDVGTARANVLDMNEQVIGICLIGDFTQYNPSDDQILSAHDLCKFFITNSGVWPNLVSWDNVVGHKELQSTACPGTSWKGPSDSMYERIKNRIPYTPVVVEEDNYQVVYKGQVLATYERNPQTIIEEKDKEVKSLKETVSQEIQNNASLQSALSLQEKDNAELLASLRTVEKERDDCKSAFKEVKDWCQDLLGIDISSIEAVRGVSGALQALTACQTELKTLKDTASFSIVWKAGKYFLGRRK